MPRKKQMHQATAQASQVLVPLMRKCLNLRSVPPALYDESSGVTRRVATASQQQHPVLFKAVPFLKTPNLTKAASSDIALSKVKHPSGRRHDPTGRSTLTARSNPASPAPSPSVCSAPATRSNASRRTNPIRTNSKVATTAAAPAIPADTNTNNESSSFSTSTSSSTSSSPVSSTSNSVARKDALRTLRLACQEIPIEKLRTATANFSNDHLVGTGSSGSVYWGILSSGTEIAVKVLNGPLKDSGFLEEVSVLSRCRHPFLVTLLGFSCGKTRNYLVYEFLPGGDLSQNMNSNKLSWRQRLRIAFEVTQAVAYLHSCDPRVFHRDIKAANILLGQGGSKLADFGLACLAGRDSTAIVTRARGTPGYADPKYVETLLMTPAREVFSLGMLFLELLTSRPPACYVVRKGEKSLSYLLDQLPLRDLPAMREQILRNLHCPPKIAQNWLSLALRCIAPKEERRPTAAEAVKELRQLLEYEAEKWPTEPQTLLNLRCKDNHVVWTLTTADIANVMWKTAAHSLASGKKTVEIGSVVFGRRSGNVANVLRTKLDSSWAACVSRSHFRFVVGLARGELRVTVTSLGGNGGGVNEWSLGVGETITLHSGDFLRLFGQSDVDQGETGKLGFHVDIPDDAEKVILKLLQYEAGSV